MNCSIQNNGYEYKCIYIHRIHLVFICFTILIVLSYQLSVSALDRWYLSATVVSLDTTDGLMVSFESLKNIPILRGHWREIWWIVHLFFSTLLHNCYGVRNNVWKFQTFMMKIEPVVCIWSSCIISIMITQSLS